MEVRLPLVSIAVFCLFSGGLALAGDHTKTTSEFRPDPAAKLSDSAIAQVLNAGKLPPTLARLRRAMETKWGPSRAQVVPFSDAPGETDLDETRTLYGAASGELFVGGIHRADGKIDFEFISRNRNGKNDFGIVRNYGSPQEEIVIVNPSACVTCHKGGGPIFPRSPWANFLGNNSRPDGLFRAFLSRLAQQDRRYRPFQEGTEALYKSFVVTKERPGGLDGFQGAVETLAKQLGDGAVWQGINLGEQFASAGRFEQAVVHANQLHVLDAYVRAAPTQKQSEERLRQVLTRAIHGDFPEDGKDDFYRAFKDIPSNRPVILKDTMEETFKQRVKGFDSSKEKFLEYHEKKKSEKWRNALPELSPTRDSSFLADSHALTGQGTQRHSDELNILYYGPLLASFLPLFDEKGTPPPLDRSSQILKSRFEKDYRRPLDGKDQHQKAVITFQTSTLNDFLKSDHLRMHLRGGTLPSPSTVHSAFRDFVTGAPAREVPYYRGDTKEVNRERTCLDCHAGLVDGVRFNFEMSNLAAWRREMASGDEGRMNHARRWARGVLRSLRDETMPPEPFRLVISANERRELVRYLETLTAR